MLCPAVIWAWTLGRGQAAEAGEPRLWCESQLCYLHNHVTLCVPDHLTKPQFVSEDPSS